MIKGLGTVIYFVPDMEQAKAWYTKAFGKTPYFDQPFYMGFNIGGYELGLEPKKPNGTPGPGGCIGYWRVEQIDDAVRHFGALGASTILPVQDVGEGIKVAVLADPFGNQVGLIENPHFKVAEA